jgi:prepilin-type N-terminal cleavage/methylation domain-containing protein
MNPSPGRTASLHRRRQSVAGRSVRGFTLIELVAAIVILGVVAAVAVQVFRDLRYDARRAALDGIRATMVANMNTARAAWLARGSSAGGTLSINGRLVEVYGEGATDGYGSAAPPGAPTAAGMFRMLGCEAPIPDLYTVITCEALPGMLVYVDDGFLGVWHAATTSDFLASGCYVGYYPAIGFDPWWPVGPTDAYAGFHPGSNYAFYPKSVAVGVGQVGC